MTFVTIKDHKGSAYESWLEMGMPENLSAVQQEMLEAHSIPEYEFEILDTINRRLEIGFILKPNEVLYIEVQKKAARAYLGNENDKATSHLNSLLMLDKKV